MNQDLTALKLLIQKKLIKDLSFDSNDDDLNFRVTLTDLEYRELTRESVKAGLNKHQLDKLIDQVKETIRFDTKTKEVLKIIPALITPGQFVRLKTHDETGDAVEEFICIGSNRFILTNHERGALELLDELKSITSPWNVSGYIDFEVYRNDERVVQEGDLDIYRTKTIKNIQLLEPKFDFDAFYENKYGFNKKDKDKSNPI